MSGTLRSIGGNVGQAHLFDAVTGNLLQTFNDPNFTTQDRFGRSVALDGFNVLIGAANDGTLGPDVGQAHLFIIPEPSSVTLTALAALCLAMSRRRSF